ncbi:hypothetical protein Psp6_00012 [Pseudomonas phage Psp6]|nr:hypothetical protein Psp6_00012 [Pseudomonas phage Psp6]
MKTIEQRIAERAEAELKNSIAYHLAGLRALLVDDELKTDVGALLALVEERVFEVSAVRHCDYAIEAALDELQHRIYPQHGVNRPFVQGEMPTVAPAQATARRGN